MFRCQHLVDVGLAYGEASLFERGVAYEACDVAFGPVSPNVDVRRVRLPRSGRSVLQNAGAEGSARILVQVPPSMPGPQAQAAGRDGLL